MSCERLLLSSKEAFQTCCFHRKEGLVNDELNDKTKGGPTQRWLKSFAQESVCMSTYPHDQRKSPSRLEKRFCGLRLIVGVVTSILIMDLPFFLGLSLFASTVVLDKISLKYLKPQLDLHEFDAAEDGSREYTYFHRECNASDISAKHPSELIFTDDMDTLDALNLFNEHGSIVFPEIISSETAAELRSFILEENAKNKDTVPIFMARNRWSFAIHIDQHPSVAKAAKEILSNRRLLSAIEKIVGKNPAVMEFTSITASSGADVQPFHTDADDQATKFGRSYLPALSLFTVLQDTTPFMGATDICPGTHMCNVIDSTVCQEHHLSLGNMTGEGIWPVGWGALTSQQTWHRGGAYTADHVGDANDTSSHRVMFYFTFSPRPRFGPKEVETRGLQLSGTHGAPWTHFGHTLQDFAHPEKHLMSLPLRLLRTWGLFKPVGTQWGWDYVTLTLSILVPHSYQYSYGYDDFVEVKERGGLPILPRALQALEIDLEDYDNESNADLWIDFFQKTFDNCLRVAKTAYAVAFVFYAMVLFSLYTCPLLFNPRNRIIHPGDEEEEREQRHRQRPCGPSVVCLLLRLVIIHAFVLAVSCFSLHAVFASSWAAGIRSKRIYNLPSYVVGHTAYRHSLAPDLPGTIPCTNDILILDDLRSDYLGFMSTILDTYQPGNYAFGQLVTSRSQGFANLTPAMKRQLCTSVLRWSRQRGHRVLVKNKDFHWAVSDLSLALRFCHKEMMKASNGAYVAEAILQLDNLLAETKFGYWRDTHMHKSHIPKLLLNLQDEIMHYFVSDKVGEESNSGATLSSSFVSVNLKLARHLAVTRKQHKRPGERAVLLSQEPEVGPPFPQAWLQVGDVVEASFQSSMKGMVSSSAL